MFRLLAEPEQLVAMFVRDGHDETAPSLAAGIPKVML
jgi:hypothetical protein